MDVLSEVGNFVVNKMRFSELAYNQLFKFKKQSGMNIPAII
jgi:hypothetical protein